ncbi:MAG TPA: hypothetical protein P5556_06805 [Candidatus Gastranaerophilales bacterium]|nr:hypothetical protein [Candidatus Gastranaerophilales bacterium]
MENKLLKNEVIIAFLGFFIFWFVILVFSGVIDSGYQLIDDYCNFYLKDSLDNIKNLPDFFNKIPGYLNIWKNRFVPLSSAHKVFEVFLFGANRTYTAQYVGILAVFTSLFLYLFARKIRFNIFESVVFVLLTLLGRQITVWFELSRSENTGVFVLSITLFLMALSIFSNKNNKIYTVLFCFSAMLLTFAKESFIILIPAILFWKIWLYKDKNKIPFIDAFKQNFGAICFLAFVIIIELAYIYFKLSVNYGYAGVSELSSNKFLLSFLTLSLSQMYFSGIILIIFMFLYDFFQKTVKKSDIEFSKYGFLLMLFLLIVVPQIYLYAKSGFYNRFHLPISIAYALLAAYSFKFMRSAFFVKPVNFVCKALVIILCLFWFVNSYALAVLHANRGNSVSKCIEIVKAHTDEDSKVIIVSSPIGFYEETDSLETFIQRVAKREKIFILPLISNFNFYEDKQHNINLLERFAEAHEKNMIKKLEDVKDAKVIISFEVLNAWLDVNVSRYFGSKKYKMESLKGIRIYYIERNR